MVQKYSDFLNHEQKTNMFYNMFFQLPLEKPTYLSENQQCNRFQDFFYFSW